MVIYNMVPGKVYTLHTNGHVWAYCTYLKEAMRGGKPGYLFKDPEGRNIFVLNGYLSVTIEHPILQKEDDSALSETQAEAAAE